MSNISFKYNVKQPYGWSYWNKDGFDTFEEAERYVEEVKNKSKEMMEIIAIPSIDVSDVEKARDRLAKPTPKTITVYRSQDGKEFENKNDAALATACAVLNSAVKRYREANGRECQNDVFSCKRDYPSTRYEGSVKETVVFDIVCNEEIDALRTFFSIDIEWNAHGVNGQNKHIRVGESKWNYSRYCQIPRSINFIEKKFTETGRVVVKYRIDHYEDEDGEHYTETCFRVLDGKEDKPSYSIKEGMKDCCKTCAEYKRCGYSAPKGEKPRCYVKATEDAVAENFESIYSEGYTRYYKDKWIDPLVSDDFVKHLSNDGKEEMK